MTRTAKAGGPRGPGREDNQRTKDVELEVGTRVRHIGLVFGLVMVVLFATRDALAQQPAIPPPAAAFQALEKRVQELEATVQGLQTLLGMVSSNYASTMLFLDCTKPGYGVVRDDTIHVVFFVACEDISPHLEGYKVRLRIGNPYAVDFHGAEVTLLHGKDVGESLKESNRVSVSSAERVRSGYWNLVDVTIPRAKAENVRFLALLLKVNTVSLIRPPR